MLVAIDIGAAIGPAITVVAVAFGIVFVWAMTPWLAPSRDPMPDPARLADGVTVFWRPGCTFCLRLRLALIGRGHRASWVNIHRDEAASVYVRSVNDGNETVPTVVIDGTPHTNPAPARVRAALA